jgi:hypothetical protein
MSDEYLSRLRATFQAWFATAGGLEGTVITAPGAPSSGKSRLYPKSDGWYYHTNGGSETKLETTAHAHTYGSDTQVLYSASGVPSGDSGLTFAAGTDTLYVGSKIGVGSAATDTEAFRFYYQRTTNPGTTSTGLWVEHGPATTYNYEYYGAILRGYATSTSGTIAKLCGVRGSAIGGTAAGKTEVSAVEANCDVSSGGAVGTAYCFRGIYSPGATVSAAYGLYVPDITGPTGNAYGIRLMGADDYGIHIDGMDTWSLYAASGKAYFASQLGVGTEPAYSRKLDVYVTWGSTTGAEAAAIFGELRTTVSQGYNLHGIYGHVYLNYSSGITPWAFGIRSNVTKNVGGVVTEAAAYYGDFNLTAGTAPTIYGYRQGWYSITGVTTAHGVYINTLSGPTNSYGIYIQDVTGGTIGRGIHIGGASGHGIYLTGMDDYAIYADSGKNYFAGNTGIGTTPSTNIKVNAYWSQGSDPGVQTYIGYFRNYMTVASAYYHYAIYSTAYGTHTSGTVTGLRGYYGGVSATGSGGTTTYAQCIVGLLSLESGHTIGTSAAIFHGVLWDSSATTPTLHGLFLPNITGATNCYGIYLTGSDDYGIYLTGMDTVAIYADSGILRWDKFHEQKLISTPTETITSGYLGLYAKTDSGNSIQRLHRKTNAGAEVPIDGGYKAITSTVSWTSASYGEKQIVGVTIPANAWEVGATYVLIAQGYGTLNDDLPTFRVRCGASSLSGSVVTSAGYILGNDNADGWIATAQVTARTVSSSGTVIGQVIWTYGGWTTNGSTTSTTTTVDMTAARVLELTLEFDSLEAADSWYCTNAYIQRVV